MWLVGSLYFNTIPNFNSLPFNCIFPDIKHILLVSLNSNRSLNCNLQLFQPTTFHHTNIKHIWGPHGKPYMDPTLITYWDLQKLNTLNKYNFPMFIYYKETVKKLLNRLLCNVRAAPYVTIQPVPKYHCITWLNVCDQPLNFNVNNALNNWWSLSGQTQHTCSGIATLIVSTWKTHTI